MTLTKFSNIIKGIFFSSVTIIAQSANSEKSTKDLSFLIGSWEVERIYNPEGSSPRTLKGSCSCNYEVGEQFIKCVYDIARPDKSNALDIVYFNYNEIYDLYENLWFSSTWPIKVLMDGELKTIGDQFFYNTKASFLIENDVEEFVRSNWEIFKSEEEKYILRKTYIKTSKDNSSDWKFHMFEKLLMKDN